MMKLMILCLILISNLALADDLRDVCLKEYKAISSGDHINYDTLFKNRWKKYSKRCDYKVLNSANAPINKYSNNTNQYIGALEMKNALLFQAEDGLGSLTKFRKWASLNQWDQFSQINHFDWWMFPIGDESSQGYRYTVLGSNINELKEDTEYLSSYREGLVLMFLSWGWDLENGIEIKEKNMNQRWRYYDVRLRKAIQSMYLFRQQDYLLSGKKFIKLLLDSNQIEDDSEVIEFLIRSGSNAI